MTRKILHAADIHLDSPLQKLGHYEGAPAEQIRRASRRAIENMVALAIDDRVDLVVIAGDLYDGDWPDQNTGLFFVSQARRIVDAGIPLVVIRGNHDAANRMTSSLPLPKNPDGSEIMMSADAVDLRSFESLGIAVHGRSFQNRAEFDNLAAGYPQPLAGMFNLGLLHTSLTGAEGHDPYSPCTPAQLADKQYDYWALGHVHARGSHEIQGAAPVVFSGNLQGRHIRELGPKGCVVVKIDERNRCATEFCELDVVRWEICRLDVSDLQHPDQVADRFQAWLAQAMPEAGSRLLVIRVELVGQTDLLHVLRRGLSSLQASLQAIAVTYGRDQVWLESVKLRCTMPADGRPAVDLEGPLESLTAVIDQMKREEGLHDILVEELSKLARKLPHELCGEDPALRLDDPEWTNELLEAAASEVMGRLQQEAEQ